MCLLIFNYSNVRAHETTRTFENKYDIDFINVYQSIRRVPLVWSLVRLITYMHQSLHIVPLMALHTTKTTVHLPTDLNAIYSIALVVTSVF